MVTGRSLEIAVMLLLGAVAACDDASLPTAGGAGPALCAAWLTLDEFDNDPAHFWSYVLAALEVAPAAPMRLQAWVATMQRALGATLPPALDTVIAGLLNELAQLPLPLVLVLDDYQHIQAPVVHDGLHYFLSHLPPHAHVVVLTRVDPPLPLNRLRAQGLRPIQIWVPDTRTPEFAAEAHRQSLVIATSAHEAEEQAFIDAITDPDALYESDRT